MVLAPRNRPPRRLSSRAPWIDVQSNPRCWKNRWSSEAITATARLGEIPSQSTHRCAIGSSRRRLSRAMKAVVGGATQRQGSTSTTVKQIKTSSPRTSVRRTRTGKLDLLFVRFICGAPRNPFRVRHLRPPGGGQPGARTRGRQLQARSLAPERSRARPGSEQQGCHNTGVNIVGQDAVNRSVVRPPCRTGNRSVVRAAYHDGRSVVLWSRTVACTVVNVVC